MPQLPVRPDHVSGSLLSGLAQYPRPPRPPSHQPSRAFSRLSLRAQRGKLVAITPPPRPPAHDAPRAIALQLRLSWYPHRSPPAFPRQREPSDRSRRVRCRNLHSAARWLRCFPERPAVEFRIRLPWGAGARSFDCCRRERNGAAANGAMQPLSTSGRAVATRLPRFARNDIWENRMSLGRRRPLLDSAPIVGYYGAGFSPRRCGAITGSSVPGR